MTDTLDDDNEEQLPTNDEDDITLPVFNAPATQTINVPTLPQVDGHMSDAEINKVHLQMSNLEINVIYSMWPQVKSIAGVTKLIDASIKAVKHQRDLLCLPYGYRGEAQRKDIIFPPVE